MKTIHDIKFEEAENHLDFAIKVWQYRTTRLYDIARTRYDAALKIKKEYFDHLPDYIAPSPVKTELPARMDRTPPTKSNPNDERASTTWDYF